MLASELKAGDVFVLLESGVPWSKDQSEYLCLGDVFDSNLANKAGWSEKRVKANLEWIGTCIHIHLGDFKIGSTPGHWHVKVTRVLHGRLKGG